MSDMHWGLVAMGSTHHYWHVDSNGLRTFLRVEAGVEDFLWKSLDKNMTFEQKGIPEAYRKAMKARGAQAPSIRGSPSDETEHDTQSRW